MFFRFSEKSYGSLRIFKNFKESLGIFSKLLKSSLQAKTMINLEKGFPSKLECWATRRNIWSVGLFLQKWSANKSGTERTPSLLWSNVGFKMKKKRNHEFCDLADIWGVTIVPRFQCRWIKTRKKQLVSTTANSNLTRSEVERNWKEYPFLFLSKRRRKIILRSLKHNLGQRISFSWCLDVKEYLFLDVLMSKNIF